MAFIGLKYPVFAPLTRENENALPTYGTGMVMGKLIKVDLSWNHEDIKLYADDTQVERDNGMKDGSITIGCDDLSDNVLSAVFGYATAADGEFDETAAVAPYGGFGYVRKRILNGVTSYIGYWLFKVQFELSSENAETKGESTSFATPEITGTIMGVYPRADGVAAFRRHKTFTTEAEAMAWVKGLANIT